MSVHYDAFNNKFELTLKGKSSYKVEVGTDGIGNITRINNVLTDIPSLLTKAEERLETLHTQMESAKAELATPFAQAEELRAKEERLSELNALLNMDAGNDKPERGYRRSGYGGADEADSSPVGRNVRGGFFGACLCACRG